jgi:RNA polymerase-binding transcription factor DksA
MAKTKKPNPPKKNPPKTEARKATPAPKAAAHPPVSSGKRPTMEKPSKKSALRDSILARKAATKPIAFSLDEVRAIAKAVTAKADSVAKSAKAPVKPAAAAPVLPEKPAKPNHVKAASLAEILGFNPKRTKAADVIEVKDVPEKYKRYYKLLTDLRRHLTEGIERHSEETLKRSSKDDAGDLSAYGQHMADAGTDTFDRDFALSLVSSEQEALSEIDAAIKRVQDGTYGICEITAKPISKERLLAVPFTRYSAEAQKQIERNRHHSRTEAGLFGESGEEGGAIAHDDGGDE